MSQTRPSALFLIGLVAICSIWATYPFWKTDVTPVRDSQPNETSTSNSSQGFRYSQARDRLPEKNRNTEAYSNVDLASITRQLNRLAHMERTGVTGGIIENPDMPEEIRKRFRQEKSRLEEVADAYPELYQQAQNTSPDMKRVQADGSLTPEFQEVIRVMTSTGEWDELSDRYVESLENAAADKDLPEGSRPRPEDIQRARDQKHIPVL